MNRKVSIKHLLLSLPFTILMMIGILFLLDVLIFGYDSAKSDVLVLKYKYRYFLLSNEIFQEEQVNKIIEYYKSNDEYFDVDIFMVLCILEWID